MTIYLVVYSDQECYSINKAFLRKEDAEMHCAEINKKELDYWLKIEREEGNKHYILSAQELANIHNVNELEVVE